MSKLDVGKLGPTIKNRLTSYMNWIHQRLCRSDRWRRHVAAELLPWTLQGVELGDDVLEEGPGPGVTTDLLRGCARRLTALEVERAAAEALQQRLSGTGVRVVAGDGAAMPFGDSSFSAVVAFTMLHHIPTPDLQDRLFSEAWRVLRPSGVFAGFDGVGSFLFQLLHLGDTYTPVDPQALESRLQAAGFKDVVVERTKTRFRFQARRQ
jgi:SAM-dependent methyltransferase